MAVTIIATNNTGSSINIDDLGIVLSSTETRNLTDYFDYIELTESIDLYNYVSNGDIGINDGTVDLNITEGLQHLNFESVYQDLQQDESISIVNNDLAVVDVSSTTTSTMPTSWTNYTFDNTDIENNTLTLQHDNVNTERILIKEDGLYNISVKFFIRCNSGTQESTFRIIKDDTTVISYEKSLNLYNSEIHCYTENITREIITPSYITSQTLGESGSNISILSGALKITKLEGIKGDQGIPGGTTIDIQENDTTIVSNTNTINFEGSVSIVDEGNNKSTVNILPSGHVFKYVNVFDSVGGTNINILTPTEYNWDVQLIRDTDVFDHSTSSPSRIYVLKSGWYNISYVINYKNGTTGRKTIKCYIRKNGTTTLEQTSTCSYTRNTNDDLASNTLPNKLIYLDSSDYIELLYIREGSSGSATTLSNQCWIQMEFCREI